MDKNLSDGHSPGPQTTMRAASKGLAFRIRGRNTPSRRSTGSPSHGRDWPDEWTRRRTTAKQPIAAQLAELASIYVQLAADDASYATGQVYGSAGGGGQP